MNNQPKGLGFLKHRTAGAPSRERRHRLTRATAKGQSTGNLIDLMEASATFLREPHKGQPMTTAKAQRELTIACNELLARGFTKEALGE
jgi:hypothetical protein